MATALWQFVLTDARFEHIGEVLNAQDRQVNIALNKTDSMSFTVRLDNPLADSIVGGMGYIKAYRNGTLEAYGPIIGVEEAADGGAATVAVTVAGGAWVMTKRLVGLSAVGEIFSTVTDRAEVARQVIEAANARGETGIYALNPVASGSALTYTAGPYRTLYDVVTELATGYDAFDWRVFPVENYIDGRVTTRKIGSFVAQPLIGIQRPEAVFEWGTGRNNIKSYNRTVSRDTQANRVYHVASAGPDAPGYPVISASDQASIDAFLLMEDIAQGDLNDPTLRQMLVDEHVARRAYPRQIIKFEPHIDDGTGRVPQYDVDYSVGDWVRARIAYGGVTRIDAWLRIYGVQFTIDANGVERASAILAAQDNS